MKDLKPHRSEGLSDLNWNELHGRPCMTPPPSDWLTIGYKRKSAPCPLSGNIVWPCIVPSPPWSQPKHIGKIKTFLCNMGCTNTLAMLDKPKGIGHIQSRGPYHLMLRPGHWACRIPCFALLQIHMDVHTNYRDYGPFHSLLGNGNQTAAVVALIGQHQSQSPDLGVPESWFHGYGAAIISTYPTSLS